MLLACGLSWQCALAEWVDLEDSSLEESRADLAVVRGLEDPTGRPLPRLLIGLTYGQKSQFAQNSYNNLMILFTHSDNTSHISLE